VLLAQLERSREQLLESERSLRDVQVGKLNPWMGCALQFVTPQKNWDVYDLKAYMKTGIFMIKAYENWDFCDQTL